MSQTWINIGGSLAFLVGFAIVANVVANYSGYYKERGGRPVYLKRHYIGLGALAAIILISALAERFLS